MFSLAWMMKNLLTYAACWSGEAPYNWFAPSSSL